MNALQLYKYIHKNKIEYHWLNNEGTQDVIIFPSFDQLDELNKLVPFAVYEDNGIPCAIKDGYVALWMSYICEYCDIDMSDVFEQSLISIQ